MTDGTKRKLAAIVSADVSGYSRMMQVDEAGTHRRLKARYDELVAPQIEQKGGRIVKLMGDGLLAEFPSVVSAAECALEVQIAAAAADANVDPGRRIEYRIGIHLGDVIVDGDDIYGDGVNLAARLQESGDVGGISLSDDAYRQVRGKVDAAFVDGGAVSLKNISGDVRVWRWTLGYDDESLRGEGIEAAIGPAATQPLADKPSLAVLPFDNLSGDPEQEYFADGMTEDIITGLSRFRSLYVIARNSTFAYKGNSPDVRQVARDLGVRYILEGSVRRGGQRIRINAQLIDAEAGGHQWAERYDRELADIFAVQDEVTEAIIAAIAPEIDQAERNRAQRKPPESLDAWSLYQRGLAAYHATTKDGFETAIQLFDRVNDLDPGFAPAFAMGADARTRLTIHYMPGDTSLLRQAQDKAGVATTLDANDADCLWVDGKVQSFLGYHDAAVARGQEAITLNPNSAMAHQAFGLILQRAGRSDEAIRHITQAIDLSPRDLFLPGFLALGSKALYDIGRFQDALNWAGRANRSRNPRPLSFIVAAAALSELGDRDAAVAVVAEMLDLTGLKSAPELRELLFWNCPMSQERNEQTMEALRQAGLPD